MLAMVLKQFWLLNLILEFFTYLHLPTLLLLQWASFGTGIAEILETPIDLLELFLLEGMEC